MALTSALYTGLSGLDVNQRQLNVTGNNIANVNTTAYKSSRALFQSQFYITALAGSSPTSNFGGRNPSQLGLGAEIATIQKNFTSGSLQATGKTTDLAIDGDGFFILKGAQPGYTRDGSFTLNSNNDLVSSGGQYVQGFGVDANNSVIPGVLTNINVPLGEKTIAVATTTARFQGNLNAGGAVAAGSSVLNGAPLTTVGGATTPDATTLLSNLALLGTPGTAVYNVGDTVTLDGVKKGGAQVPGASLSVTATTTLGDLLSFYQGSLGINTTVPPAAGIPTPGTTIKSAGSVGNAIQIVITGNSGKGNALSFSSSNSVVSFADGTTAGPPPIASNPSGESLPTDTQIVAFDSLGNQLHIYANVTLESKTATGTTWRFYASSPDNVGGDTVIGTGTLTFDNNGKLTAQTGNNVTLSRTGTGAKSPQGIALDFGTLTSLKDTATVLQQNSQDGYPIGTLSGFNIDADGSVVGTFTNSLTRKFGQVAVATFKNTEGLTDNGGNVYAASTASGTAVIGSALSNSAGSIRSGALEQSNVDLSTEFTNLIVSSTGFSAASRVITTSDALIQELLNIKR